MMKPHARGMAVAPTGGGEVSSVPSLLLPDALGPGTGVAELIQTHISYVLLAGERAVKLKKPREMGFLDFTTPERRRAACQAEVRLNQRLTHHLYLGVAPVLPVPGGGHRLGAPGEDDGGAAVDWAVVMRRLPAERMLDRLVLVEGAIPAGFFTRLGEQLADFYRRAATDMHIASFARPSALLANWQENFAQTLPHARSVIGVRRYAAIAAAVYRDVARLGPLFEQRIAEGRARDCHGDLRLASLCLEEDGTVQVYDCIEFNERFRYGDAAADIAFLSMDLEGHGRADLAAEFIAAYIARSGDTTLPAVLPFYQCYRAYVRGKVDAFQLDEPEIPAAQRRTARAAARQRFAQAARYARRSGVCYDGGAPRRPEPHRPRGAVHLPGAIRQSMINDSRQAQDTGRSAP